MFFLEYIEICNKLEMKLIVLFCRTPQEIYLGESWHVIARVGVDFELLVIKAKYMDLKMDRIENSSGEMKCKKL